MKKLIVPAGCMALLLAAAVPAQAGNVAGARVNADPEAVRAYWTPERMSGAIPAERLRPGPQTRARPGSGSSATSSSTAKVSWSAAEAITRTNGKVYFVDNGVRYVCSGTAAASPNFSVVWTAGHCVHGGGSDEGFHTNFMFVPAYNSVVLPNKTFVATHLYTMGAWASSEQYGRDVGAAVVSKTDGTFLTEWAGSRDIGFTSTGDYASQRRMDSFGYPAAGKYNGESLYACDSYLRYAGIDNANPPTMGIPCGMTGGSSGGAWIDDWTARPGGAATTLNTLVSVNSYGYSSLKNVMFGPVMDESVRDLLRAAETTTSSAGVPGTS